MINSGLDQANMPLWSSTVAGKTEAPAVNVDSSVGMAWLQTDAYDPASKQGKEETKAENPQSSSLAQAAGEPLPPIPHNQHDAAIEAAAMREAEAELAAQNGNGGRVVTAAGVTQLVPAAVVQPTEPPSPPPHTFPVASPPATPAPPPPPASSTEEQAASAVQDAETKLAMAEAESRFAQASKVDTQHPEAYAAAAARRDQAVAAAQAAAHVALRLQGQVEQARLQRASERRDRREQRAVKRAQDDYEAVEKESETTVSALAKKMSELALAVARSTGPDGALEDEIKEEEASMAELHRKLEETTGVEHTIASQQYSLAEAKKAATVASAKYAAAKELVKAARTASPAGVERAIGVEEQARQALDDANSRLLEVTRLVSETEAVEAQAEHRGEEKVLRALHKHQSDIRLIPTSDSSPASSEQAAVSREASKDTQMEAEWHKSLTTALDKSDKNKSDTKVADLDAALLARGPPSGPLSKLGALLKAKTQGDAKRKAAIKRILLRAAHDLDGGA